jgi:hypothetical protein
MNQESKNSGSAMIMLLVMIAVGGIISAKIAPRYETSQKRNTEDRLKTSLSEIRQAMDLLYIVGTMTPNFSATPTVSVTGVLMNNTPPPMPDWLLSTDTYSWLKTPTYGLVPPASVAVLLRELENYKLLRTAQPFDATFLTNRWSPNATETFWMITSNVALNPSFEVKTTTQPLDATKNEVFPSWSVGSEASAIETDTTFYPTKDSSLIDDYPGQNKLGDPYQTTGSSLKLNN